MSRMMSAIRIVAMISMVLLSLAPMAFADQSTIIPLGYTFPRAGTTITVVLEKLEVSDYRMGNVYSSTPQDRVEWIRLWYHYENTGDKADDGYLQVEFIDDKGNVYKEPDGTYTGETVAAQSKSVIKFIEIPISKGSTIVKIKSIQGFDEKEFDVPQAGGTTPTAVPTTSVSTTPVSTATPTPTAVPSSGGSGNCLPLLPFAILSAIGLAGLATGKINNKK